jgi:predicted RNA-binding protein with PIN domain
MAYLIDGNNLLGRLASHELKEPGGREGLVARLLAFQKVTRTRILLVFDGKPRGEETSVPVNPKFTILFPDQGKSADDVIKDAIGRQTDRRHFFVVSSDRDIRDFARKSGLRSVTSDEFVRELKTALKERKKQREMEKRSESPSPLEIDLWNEVFKRKP